MLKDSFSEEKFNKLVYQTIPLIKSSGLFSEFEKAVAEAGEMTPEEVFILHATLTAAKQYISAMADNVSDLYEAEENIEE